MATTPARNGDTVSVRYTIRLRDGRTLAPLGEGELVEFTLGTGGVLPGFERATLGMTQDERKTVTLSPDDAYGPYEPERLFTIDRGSFPSELEPLAVGRVLRMSREDAPDVFVTVKAASERTVTLDANHPLAGQELVFEIYLVRISRSGSGGDAP
jgi:peptidylprolyl isomerase